MKCLCGYEQGYDHDEEKDIGDEKFIKLNVAFVRDDRYDFYYRDPSPSALYACPKCGTVKVDYP